jgi:aflatoxin B1 aldehyde reductase
MWYLHAPDRSTPYKVTLKAIDELHKEGKFRRWGLSNYLAWEVAEIVHICKTKGYVLPSVYQGIYNAVHRWVLFFVWEARRALKHAPAKLSRSSSRV